MPEPLEHGSSSAMDKSAVDSFSAVEVEDDSSNFKPLTRAEVQALRERFPLVSPWKVLGIQALVGLSSSVLIGLVWGEIEIFWSALYGVACVVLPGAVMARGMTRVSGRSPGGVLLGFAFWEAVKVMFAVAMLVLATTVVPGLNWLSLLVTMILSMKVSWLVLVWRRRQP